MGITPARAGKTAGDRAVSTACRTTPARAERLHRSRVIPTAVRIPPLVRERPERLNNLEVSNWIYPRSCGKDHDPCVWIRTYVTSRSYGKDQFVKMKVTYCQDHPRSCGKDLSIICAFIALGVRIIPRSCGKDLSHDPPRQHLRGSPPLVRERRTASCKPDNGSGITPARAGKTVKTLPIRRQCQDHPRSCGKDFSTLR